MISADDALAKITSLSLIPPTAACSTRTDTSLVESFSIEPTIASSEPCTSDLTMTGSSLATPAAIRENICSSVPRAPEAALASRRRRCRKSAMSRARPSFSATTKSSPASGVPFKPSTSIGVPGAIGFDYDSGGYCDDWGCPDEYWDMPVYYGPVYFRRESEPYMTLALARGRGTMPASASPRSISSSSGR